jgi:hypothetical protein
LIKTVDDLKTFYETDDTFRGKIEALRSQATAYQSQLEHAQLARLHTFKENQSAEFASFLKSVHPDALGDDGTIRPEVVQAAWQYLTEAGMTPQEIQHRWNFDPSFMSANTQKVIFKAMSYDRAKAKLRNSAKMPLPAPQRPGTARDPREARDSFDVGEADKALTARPSVRNAAKLLSARRAARG